METENFLQAIGNKIKAARNKAGISQENLCLLMDMKPATLIKIEKGNVAARIITLKRISDALQVELKDFL